MVGLELGARAEARWRFVWEGRHGEALFVDSNCNDNCNGTCYCYGNCHGNCHCNCNDNSNSNSDRNGNGSHGNARTALMTARRLTPALRGEFPGHPSLLPQRARTNRKTTHFGTPSAGYTEETSLLAQ